jgi:hypothetical protein
MLSSRDTSTVVLQGRVDVERCQIPGRCDANQETRADRDGNEAVPPGFGVKLADATRSNMSAWLGGYREFQRTLGLD